MNKKFLRLIWMFSLFMTLIWTTSLEVEAQSTSPEIKLLDVALWPEYDQPEVLVIYRVQLTAGITLPAQLTFRLPDYIESFHAVAYEDETGLVNIDPASIEWYVNGDERVLTFPAPSTTIQFEYYDPVILSKENHTRQLNFEFTAPYPIQTATFEVQEPQGAEEFSLDHEPYATINGRDGFTYNTVAMTDLASDETFALTATYWRDTETLSAQSIAPETTNWSAESAEPSLAADTTNLLMSPAPKSPSPAAPGLTLNTLGTTVQPQGSPFNFGYILLGTGLVLLVGTGGYWWWRSNQGGNEREVMPAKTTSSLEQVALFCYQCGASLQDEAKFCHACGTERRIS